jgi:hypothetical protein
VHFYYAEALMTERLEEAENRRLVRSSRRHSRGPSVVARNAEQWLRKLRLLIGAAPEVLGSAQVTVETDCCAA